MASTSGSMSRNLANLVRQAGVVFRRSKKEGNFDEELQKLKDMMKVITPEDFNLSLKVMEKNWDYLPYVRNSQAACMDVYECADFSIGIFMIKSNSRMPLHNHPNMHGIMKILFGSLVLTSYNLQGRPAADGSFSAKCCAIEEITPQSAPCCVYPEMRNVHEIQARQHGVAFLDILGPPYDPDNSRDCTYFYRQSSASNNSPQIDHIEQLTPGKNPPWFSCIPLTYPGPKIQEDELESS